jgi:hypothetical protein
LFDDMDDHRIRSAILAACADRGAAASVCPSEVARALSPEGWRELMKPIRAAAVDLARAGRIRITQGGVDVDLDRIRGAIRLRANGQEQRSRSTDAIRAESRHDD